MSINNEIDNTVGKQKKKKKQTIVYLLFEHAIQLILFRIKHSFNVLKYFIIDVIIVVEYNISSPSAFKVLRTVFAHGDLLLNRSKMFKYGLRLIRLLYFDRKPFWGIGGRRSASTGNV